MAELASAYPTWKDGVFLLDHTRVYYVTFIDFLASCILKRAFSRFSSLIPYLELASGIDPPFHPYQGCVMPLYYASLEPIQGLEPNLLVYGTSVLP